MAIGELAMLIKALAWPITALVLGLFFRAPLSALVNEWSQRVTKFSFAGAQIDLTAATEISPNRVANFDIAELQPAKVFDSASSELFKQLSESTHADYAVIDLGQGDKWLASRLYIFATVLHQVSGIKQFVFLYSNGNRARQWLGMAEPEQLRRALAIRFPWFEMSYIKSLAAELGDPLQNNNAAHISDMAQGESWRLSNVIAQYVQAIQQPTEPVDLKGWSALGNPVQHWERSPWITGLDLEEWLQQELATDAIVETLEKPFSELVDPILRSRNSYVALVDHDNRFKRLIDRMGMLEQLRLS